MADNSPSRFSQSSNDSHSQQQQQQQQPHTGTEVLSLEKVQQVIASNNAQEIVDLIGGLNDVASNSEDLPTMKMLLRTAMYEEKASVDNNSTNLIRYDFKLTKLFLSLSVCQLSKVLSSPHVSSKQLQKFILVQHFEKFNVERFIQHYQGMYVI